MTNAALKECISSLGDRMFAIGMDNTRTILFGYPNQHDVSDIQYHTFDGIEFFSLKSSQTKDGITVNYRTYEVTSNVQWIGATEPDSAQYLPDPNTIK